MAPISPIIGLWREKDSDKQDSACKLTKFVQLNNEDTVIDEYNHQRQAQQEVDKLQTSKLNQFQTPSKINDDTENTEYNRPFQIVWTGLSYEVGLNSYDKFVNTTLDYVKNIWSLGGASCWTAKEQSLQRDDDPEKTIDKLCQKVQETSQDVNSFRPKSKESSSSKRVIFENLNGYISSGELLAILGPSGSGKTSLLNAICGKTENYRGQIRLNGGDPNKRMRLSIIPQKDYLIENLTVRENLLYSSRLLNPNGDFDHEANILRVVRMLNLTACFNSVVMNISGGEYKRVSIALELLRQPDILILDEPTSGLDSLNCKNLIGSLVKLVEASREGLMKPIAIAMTIHQPDVDVYHMFDHVYCMARGGVIYDGRPKDTMQVIKSQANLTTDNSLPPTSCQLSSHVMSMNPANLLIEIASEHLYGQEPIDRLTRFHLEKFDQMRERLTSNCALRGTRPLDGFKTNSNEYGQKHACTKNDTKDFKNRPIDSQYLGYKLFNVDPLPRGNTPNSAFLCRDKRLSAKNDHSGLFWYHTKVLAQRGFVSTFRDPLLTFISLAFYLTLPFVLWTIYPASLGSTHGCPMSQRDMDIVSLASNKTSARLENLQEQVRTTLESSVMFFSTTNAFSMCTLLLASLAFPMTMHILLKEVRNGWYNLSTYVLAETIANFPFQVLFPVISFFMIYLLLGMPSSTFEWRLWSMALVMALISLISTTQGLIFGALCMDNVQTAIFLASSSILPQILLSGFTARIKYMPWFLQKLSLLAQQRHSTDLINMIRFGFGICPCDSSTDEYLRTKRPQFTDVPSGLKSLFYYYLTGGTGDSPVQNNTSQSNGDGLDQDYVDSSSDLAIAGIYYELKLNATERSEFLKRVESNEIDLLERLANLLSRSFSFGRKLDGCESVRSQNLTTFGTPPDDQIFVLFGWLFVLLVVFKLLLFVAVRHQIRKRI